MIHLLGKHPPRIDPNTPKLAKYTLTLPAPSESVDWYSLVSAWNPLGNMTIGDCTLVAVAHAIAAMTRYTFGVTDAIPKASVIRAYSAVSGYIPGRPRTDMGADMLTVMQYWHRVGLAGHKINSFAAVNWLNTVELKNGIELFGAAHVGLALPNTWTTMVTPGTVWDIPSGQSLTGDWAPNINNGHAVPLLGYLSSGNYAFPSWNGLYYMTPAFVAAYVDECFVAYSQRDWMKNGVAPSGMNLTQWQADMGAIAA